MLRNRFVSTLAIGLIAAAAGAALGSAIATGQGSVESPTSGIVAPSHEKSPQFKVNSSGMSYGSALDSVDFESEPDLILVVATNGKEGYVKKEDLEGQMPKSPGDAPRPGDLGETRTITVFASDGTTKVGLFVVGPDAPS